MKGQRETSTAGLIVLAWLVGFLSGALALAWVAEGMVKP